MQIPYKKTKIIATLGPSSSSLGVIKTLLLNGANVFRINFSHGSHQDHKNRIELIGQASRLTGISCGILADLQGPKIRTGITDGDRPVTLTAGSLVTITSKKIVCTDKLISIDYPGLAHEVSLGSAILLNDGAVRMTIVKIDTAQETIRCCIDNTGTFSSHKGVNLPGAALTLPSMTAKDHRDLKFILTQNIHFIALSFVRKPEDLTALHKAMARAAHKPKIIAKIEKPEAAERIDQLLAHCDGIMVARGDLGVETSPDVVPIIQKDLISKANNAAKLVIVATQMLESMINSPLPTRAESTDVANAILDGADATMLSGETAAGHYPCEAVAMMAKIARTTEASRFYCGIYQDLEIQNGYPPHAVCEAAATACADLGNIPALVFTLSGNTALYLSKIRNQSRIFAFSPDPRVVAMLSLAWNITAFILPFDRNIASLQKRAERILLQQKLVVKGDPVTIVGGTTSAQGATNFMRIKHIGGE